MTSVEPSLQAAFVDFGAEKNGFLHVSDVVPSLFPPELRKEVRERGPRGAKRPPIQKVLRKGVDLLVQVTKVGVARKGAALTTYLSLPGRCLVLMPGLAVMGVSRKIEDEEARLALRKVVHELKPPKDVGVIARTAAIGRPKRDLEKDLRYLARLWETIQNRAHKAPVPSAIYQESDFVIRVVRDVFSADMEAVIAEGEDVRQRIIDFMKIVMPRYCSLVKLYQGEQPFARYYNIEEQIETIYKRSVPLSKGGSIVIDQTEAVVAIDVNSGTFRVGKDPEETAYQLNLAAAAEAARQLRLRDLGGVIIIDFVDMKKMAHRRGVEQVLGQALRRDRARTDLSHLSKFCIVEMTRQRMRPSVERALVEECPTCRGRGTRRTRETVAVSALRKLRAAAAQAQGGAVTGRLHPEAADYLQNHFRKELAEIEERFNCSIRIEGASDFLFDAIETVE
ncbi:MAG: Rne/Rng family ribonuclease [Planctomycetota bacterium]